MRASTLFWFSLTAQALAVALAVVEVSTGTLGAGLIGAVAALALTVWTQLDGHDASSKKYALASEELSSIAALANSTEAEQGLEKIVLEGESLISSEFTLYLAHRREPSAVSTS
jgi:hypothetical protein